jgi:hypothetical protein
MSSFICEQCGTAICDTPQGYISECPHYPLETLNLVHPIFVELLKAFRPEDDPRKEMK